MECNFMQKIMARQMNLLYFLNKRVKIVLKLIYFLFKFFFWLNAYKSHKDCELFDFFFQLTDSILNSNLELNSKL